MIVLNSQWSNSLCRRYMYIKTCYRVGSTKMKSIAFIAHSFLLLFHLNLTLVFILEKSQYKMMMKLKIGEYSWFLKMQAAKKDKTKVNFKKRWWIWLLKRESPLLKWIGTEFSRSHLPEKGHSSPEVLEEDGKTIRDCQWYRVMARLINRSNSINLFTTSKLE